MIKYVLVIRVIYWKYIGYSELGVAQYLYHGKETTQPVVQRHFLDMRGIYVEHYVRTVHWGP